MQAEEAPSQPAIVPAGSNGHLNGHGTGVILAAVDGSPAADLVIQTAARLAADGGRVVHVVHAQEGVTGADGGTDGEALAAAEAVVRDHLDRLAARHVPAEGHVLLHGTDHGAAGKLIADYANEAGATTIVVGPATHHGLAALMDESASAELGRHARGEIVVANEGSLSRL